MKVLIVAGGGGHFSAALSVIEAFPKGSDLVVVGRKYAFEGDNSLSFEYQTAKEKNILFETIESGRIQRTFTIHTIPSFLKTPIGLLQSFRLLQKHKPDAVLSFGGYVAVPIVLAAYILRIPIIIHEQALKAGLANKVCSYFAKKICISWESSRGSFPRSKTVLTGLPIKHSIRKETSSRFLFPKGDLPLLVVMGGSGGSHKINILIEGLLPRLLEVFCITQQTGDAKRFRDYDRLVDRKEELSQEKKDRYVLTKYIDSDAVGKVLRLADLVVARAGINTVSELLYLGKAALLIPLQSGQRNEQLQNAKLFQREGLGTILSEDASSEEFFAVLKEMASHLDKYRRTSEKINDGPIDDANDQVISVVKNVVQASK